MPFNADGLYYRNSEIYWKIKNFKDSPVSTSSACMITCPHCGCEFMDSWEYSGEQHEIEIECEECENEFKLLVEIEVNYTTWKKD